MSGPARRVALAIAIAAVTLDAALLGLIAPLLPEIEARTGASESALGLALAAYAVPVLLVSLPLGRLTDLWGRRSILLSGVLLTAVGSLTIAHAHDLGMLLLGRGTQGLGAAASWIAGLALVSDLAPRGRTGESLGYVLAATAIGAIGGPAISGITAEAIGFTFPFMLVATLAMALFLLGIRGLPVGLARAGGPRRPAGQLLATAVSPATRPATLAVIVTASLIGAVQVVVPLDADARLGLSAASIGSIFAISVLLDGCTAPLAGRAGDRIGRWRVALVGLLVAALSQAMLALLSGVAGMIAGVAVFSVGCSAVVAASVPWLDESYGQLDKGFAYGIVNLMFSVGYVTGPTLAGAGMDLSNPDAVYLVTAALLFGAAALFFAWRTEVPPDRARRLTTQPVTPR